MSPELAIWSWQRWAAALLKRQRKFKNAADFNLAGEVCKCYKQRRTIKQRLVAARNQWEQANDAGHRLEE